MNENTLTTEEILSSSRQSRKIVARENALGSILSGATGHSIDQVLLAGALMVELQKLQEHPILRRKIKDILRLGLRRPLSHQGDQRSARVSEADVMLFNYIFFRMFAITPDITWKESKNFSPGGWCQTWHADIVRRTNLSPSEVRRSIRRLKKARIIETGYRRKSDSLELDGLFILPDPFLVFELYHELPAARKAESDCGTRFHFDQLARVSTVTNTPPTPAWLREREEGWRLLYLSNFKSVLPSAIRHHKAGSSSRRRIGDRRQAIVPEGHIRVALAMMRIFGIDERGRLLGRAKAFDEAGNRMLSQSELMKKARCSPRQVRDALKFFKEAGVCGTLYKRGATYKGSKNVRRVRWAWWSFSKFVEFLQFPGSRFDWKEERLRHVILAGENPNQTEIDDYEEAEKTLELPGLLSDINARVFNLSKRQLSDATLCSPASSFSGIQKREKAALPPSSFSVSEPEGDEKLPSPRDVCSESYQTANTAHGMATHQDRSSGCPVLLKSAPITGPSVIPEQIQFPGLCGSDRGLEDLNDPYLPFYSFAKAKLPPSTRRLVGSVPLTGQDGRAIEFGDDSVALVTEEVAFCAGALRHACLGCGSMEQGEITFKKLKRLRWLVEAGWMTPEIVTWYVNLRSMRGFAGPDEYLNAMPLEVLLTRWATARAAYDRAQQQSKAAKFYAMPRAHQIDDLPKWFKTSVKEFPRKSPGQRSPIIVSLGWMHARGMDVESIVPTVVFERLAKKLRTEPCLYAKLRSTVPLDKWCGFVTMEQLALASNARKEYEKSLIRGVWLHDFEREEFRFELGNQERQTRQDKREAEKVEAARQQHLGRLATCLPGLNSALGGGFVKSSVTLISAITGGGKTVLAQQLASGFAGDGYNVAMLSSEIETDGSLKRLCSHWLSIEIPTLEGLLTDDNGAGLFPRLRERYPEKTGRINHLESILKTRLAIVPWKSDATTRDLGVEAQFQESCEGGFRPKVLILDGLTTQAEKVAMERCHHSGMQDFSRECRAIFKETVSELLKLSERHGLVILATLQADKGSAGSMAVTPDMIAETPRLLENFKRQVGFIGISRTRNSEGQRDPQQFLSVIPAIGHSQMVPVRSEFKYQRFVDCAAA